MDSNSRADATPARPRRVPVGIKQRAVRGINMSKENLFEYAPVIFSYTPVQAIEDGVLVDLTELASETGLDVPARLAPGHTRRQPGSARHPRSG